VNLFIQGMRRSGTTILYDALLEDPDLRCFYEPLREEKVTVGGGSGARESDAFAETRALRRRFQRDRYPEIPVEEFNWGGPREPRLELEAELPDHCREWLRYLLEQAPQVAIKETRFYRKVPSLAELDPGALLVHVVRDPRGVAASIVLGRGRRRAADLPTPAHFFADREKRKLWSSRPISRRLIRDGYANVRRPSNVLRVLLVWRLTFEETWREGRRLFGDRYLLLRNEELRAEPEAALGRVYAALGRPVPEGVLAWARANIREPEEVYAAGDPRWAEELERAGAAEALERAGYSGLAADTLKR
jgi:hypothetical protein